MQPYKPADKLAGKKSLITGGSSGIGRAITILYAMAGAESLTKKLVEAKGGKIHLLATNLKLAVNCKKSVDAAVQTMGTVNFLVNILVNMLVNMLVNILVNNNWYQMMKDISELEQWEHTFQTNIHPFFFLSKYVLPHMKSGDSITNCASIDACIGRPDLLDYTSTKGAIVPFTRGLHK
ncbi:MAG: hypothetical protein M1832_002992 [Thelocarpon impressellum]|nr:MAG: hypothetical protein M1832_002992 [Thelocarpon impressellum]